MQPPAEPRPSALADSHLAWGLGPGIPLAQVIWLGLTAGWGTADNPSAR